MTEAVPGLTAAAAETEKLIDQFIILRDEGESCHARIATATARILQMQDAARQSKPWDMLEFSILQAQVRRDEARRAEITQGCVALERQMTALCETVDAATKTAIRRHNDIVRAANGPGGHA